MTDAPPRCRTGGTTGSRLASLAGVAILAAFAYLPSLDAKGGRMPSDTKVFLYLDPGRLLSDAALTWDTSQFAGWVPHQVIAYLWPSGPWFWFFETLGVPDWIAHRLWLGTILFLAGLGVRWAARQLGLGPLAAFIAAVVYQLSPYVLPYVSRTSVMLLPWAGVGWLVGLTVRTCARGGWRDPALFALVVLTVGSVNATALALIAPAPILWLLSSAWQRSITWRVAGLAAAKLGALSLAVSVWWIVMLSVQGRHGADVLSFSESLEAVSLTSVSTETLRGLGYWLFYVRDPWGFTTTASIPYMESGRVILAGYALTAIGLVGILLTRWVQRRYAALLVFTGIVLAVGVHPIDDPSPLMAPVEDSALGLALRSSTRALPLSIFGLALGTGALVSAVGGVRVRTTRVARRLPAHAPQFLAGALVALVGILTLVQLPALFDEGFVDPALERDQDPPAAWMEAAAVLDAGSTEHRVLQLAGAEFGAFRWGYTVDPPLPGLTNKPLVTRDLLPLGSAGAMDLLYALDNRFQVGIVEPASIAPIARLLGVDTIWLTNDAAFDRFRTPRPELVAAIFDDPPAGLGPASEYGVPQPNVPVLEMVDEQLLSDARIGTPLATVELVPVLDPQPIVRADSDVVVVAGSGDGLVDAAAAGLLDGRRMVLYVADLADGELAELGDRVLVVVTDSNRDRALHWRGSQDVAGLTETGGPGADVTREDDADERLAVFDSEDPAAQTTASLDGGLVVRASAYGEPAAYRPEQRPAMAVDGDPTTAWVVADRADPIGESIELSRTDGKLALLQPQGVRPTREITLVRIDQPGTAARLVELTVESTIAPGQTIDVVADQPVTITIEGVTERPGTDIGASAVGFAELGPVALEVVRPPSDALAETAAFQPLAIVLTRDRVRPTNRWRSDPEPALVRELDLPTERSFDLTVTLRLDQRADEAVLNVLVGEPDAPRANRRLVGVAGARGSAALDGDPSTAWTTPFGEARGSEIVIPLDGTTPISSLTFSQPVDALHSPLQSVRVQIGELDVEVAVPPPDAAGTSTIGFPPTAGEDVTITITDVASAFTRDRRYGEMVELPAAITEIGGLDAARPLQDAVETSAPCRSDLLTIDGREIPLAVDGSIIARLLAGESVDVSGCAESDSAIELGSGPHRIVGTNATRSGIDVDRVTLTSRLDEVGKTDDPTVTVLRDGTDRVATVSACPAGCWLVLGEGHNDEWRAFTIDDGRAHALGPSRQVDGGFNGWWLPPSNEERTVLMTWPPQRGLDAALVVTAVAVVGCVAIVVVSMRRRRRWRTAAPLDGVDLGALVAPPSGTVTLTRVSRQESVIAAAVLVGTAGLVIAPLWAAIALVPAALVVLLRRPLLLGVGAVALTAVLGVIVTRRELAERYFLNASWPGHFEDLHRAGLFAVVLLLAACLGSRGPAADTVAAAARATTGNEGEP